MGEIEGGGQQDIDKKIQHDMKIELKKILNNNIYKHKEGMISDLFSHMLSRRNLLLERKLGLGQTKLFDNTPLLQGGGIDQYGTDVETNDDREDDNDFLEQQPKTSAADGQNSFLQRNLPNDKSESPKKKTKVSDIAKDTTKRREIEHIIPSFDSNAKKIRNIERKIKLVLKISKLSLKSLTENCNKAISFFKKSYYKKFFIFSGSNIVDTNTKIKFDSMKIIASISLNRNEIFSLLTLKSNGKVKMYSRVEREFLKKFCKLLGICNIPCDQIKNICK